MVESDFEYRFYDGAPAGTSVLQIAMGIANPFLRGLAINTVSSLKFQLLDFLGTTGLGNTSIGGMTVSDYVAALDPELRLPRVVGELMKGSFEHLGVKYSISVNVDGDWGIIFPDSTFDLIPPPDSPFDSISNQIQFRINLDQIYLLNFGIDVRYWNPLTQDWKRLKKFDLLDGSKLTGLHARILLSPTIDQSLYEIIPSSGQKFRPVTLALAGFGLSNDHTEINVGGDVSDWLIDGLNYVASHVYGGLNFYQAIANKVMHDLESKVQQASHINLPALLDFPAEAKYGQAFGIPSGQRVTFLYHPEIDIVGTDYHPDNDIVHRPRAIHFRNIQISGYPPNIDPSDLFDPSRFISLGDVVKDQININGYLADIFNVTLPIPDPDTNALSRGAINEAVQQFAEPRFQARDESLLHLLKDEVPSAVLSGLRWGQIDFVKRTIRVIGQVTTEYKISPDSIKALRVLQRQQMPTIPGKRPPRPDPSTAVFIVPRGWQIGERGIISLWLAYKGLVDLGKNWPAPWEKNHTDNPPLPEITEDYPAALGYAVNFIVPNVQFGFLHAIGGLNLGKIDFHTSDFLGIYSPFLSVNQDFGVQMISPSQAPPVDFFNGGMPLLNLANLAVELKLNEIDAQPLQVKLNVTAGIKPDFKRFLNCAQGKEEDFLTLVQNLVCLAEMGLIELKGNITEIMQGLLHPYPIVLVHDGHVTVQIETIESQGTFPSGMSTDPSWLAELNALLTATLPEVLDLLIPVPVLFDLFHIVPENLRDEAHQVLGASYGWMTLIQPITLP